MKKAIMSYKRDIGFSFDAISVSGVKSIDREQRIDIYPLTVLSGSNSSGKSSIMHPILLLKQTLDAAYDPGVIKLDGPNVRFTAAKQLLSKGSGGKQSDSFSMTLTLNKRKINLIYKNVQRKGLTIHQLSSAIHGEEYTLRDQMTKDEMMDCFVRIFSKREFIDVKKAEPRLVRDRCFLKLYAMTKDGYRVSLDPFMDYLAGYLSSVIHLPGLRGNPLRTYSVAGYTRSYPGTFDNYAASIIRHWATTKSEKLDRLGHYLSMLGLTWKVTARRVDDTQIEIKVGRLPKGKQGGALDLVNIADVGVGVSQTLPILVALLIAKAGQIVFIEQPEIHLHPRAQLILAEILAEFALTGIKIVIETHSSQIIKKLQILSARNVKLSRLIKLHWFSRDAKTGSTLVRSAALNEDGAFGDWPADFDEIELNTEREYLNVLEKKRK